MKIDGTIRATLLKIKALAESGSSGERDNASRLLSKRLGDLNLTLRDLEGDRLSRHWFMPGSKHEKALLMQIAAVVIGRQAFDARGSYYRVTRSNKRVPKSIGMDLSDWEYIEISYLYDAMIRDFRAHLKESREVAAYAFYRTNDLLAKPLSEQKEITQEEVRMAIRAAALAREMDPVKLPRKQLTH